MRIMTIFGTRPEAIKMAPIVVARRRLETRAGEVSKGVTVEEPDVLDLAHCVAEALPFQDRRLKDWLRGIGAKL